MNVTRLNNFRWILIIVSLLCLLTPILLSEFFHFDYDDLIVPFSIPWLLSLLILLIVFNYKRSTVGLGLKRFLFTLFCISAVLLLENEYVTYFLPTEEILLFLLYSLLLSIYLVFFIYLEMVEIILLGLIVIIILGFVINRLGSFLGNFIIPISFSLSALGNIFLTYKSMISFKEKRQMGKILIPMYALITIINTLLFIKFISNRPDLSFIYDTIGVIVYLLACFILLITLPFSDFIEWSNSQKLSFKRLIILPLILFLVIFSLKFLLPENAYKKIFFKEYSNEAKVHFGMKDYKVDFNKQ